MPDHPDQLLIGSAIINVPTAVPSGLRHFSRNFRQPVDRIGRGEPVEAPFLDLVIRQGTIVPNGDHNAHGLAVFPIALAPANQGPGGGHGPFPGQTKCVE